MEGPSYSFYPTTYLLFFLSSTVVSTAPGDPSYFLGHKTSISLWTQFEIETMGKEPTGLYTIKEMTLTL